MLYSVFIYIKTNTTKHTLIIFVYILMLYFVIIDTLMILINILMLYLIFVLYKNKHYETHINNICKHFNVILCYYWPINDIDKHTNAIFSTYTYKNNEY